MRITFTPQQNYNNPNFQAMKKSQFSGLDFFIVEKFKAPIEKFNTHKDFQTWAKTQFEKLRLKNFGGRSEQSIAPRQNIIEDWAICLTNTRSKYSNAEKLLILSGITAGLKPNTDDIPPSINHNVLSSVVTDLKQELSTDRKRKFNFRELYDTQLKNTLLKEYGIGGNYTGWIEIFSKEHSPKNYKKNVDLLKILSHKFWCTKHYTAEDYLKTTDFSIYLENGKPKLGLRMTGLDIEEVQGERNDGHIPIEYLEIFEDYFQTYGLGLTLDAEVQYFKATDFRDFYNPNKEFLEKHRAVDSIDDAKAILNRFSDSAVVNDDGLLTVTNYKQPHKSYAYMSLGIDENKLFQYISEIKGDVTFRMSNVTDLGSLKKVDGVIYINDSHLSRNNFDNIEHKGIYATIYDSLLL